MAATTSDKNLCSKQGYISNVGEAIVCLPNLVVIEIKTSDIDGVIRWMKWKKQ